MNFEAGNETREKNGSDFVAEQTERWSETRVTFCSYRCFLESEKSRCEKKFCKRAKFCVHVRHFKAVFLKFFLVKRFGYDFVLTVGWFW